MASLTPEDAIVWLSNSNYDRGLGGEIANIQIARRGMASFPPDSQAYKAHQQVMENSLSKVAKAQEDESYEAAGIDPAFNNAACDCEPGEPCCLRAFEVADNKDKSRKIIWPVPKGDPSKLFVITKDAYNGSPSAKVEVKMTDFEKCKQGKELTPWIFSGTGDEFADDPLLANPTGSVVKTVTSPFQIPAIASTMLPAEVITAIYIAGMLIQAKTYRKRQEPSLAPSQCYYPTNEILSVLAVPYCKLSANLNGSVALTINFSSAPSFIAKLTGSIKGEYGNQTLNYTGEKSIGSAPREDAAQGPVNHPLFDFLDKIQSSMDGLADQGRRSNAPRIVQKTPRPTSLEFSFAVNVDLPSLELKGKSGSPNLELSLDPFGIEFGPSITGTIDLVELMLSRIPYGNDIRDALAHDGNAVSASAECTVTVEGKGTVGLNIENAALIEIGSNEGWEAEFGSLNVVYSGKMSITGTILVSARLDVRTWFFDASGSARANVSTGWQFGGRITENPDGTQKWEKMYHFQGIRLKAYVSFRAGAEVGDQTDGTLGTTSGDTVTTVKSSGRFSAQSNLGEPAWERTLMREDGSETEWQEI